MLPPAATSHYLGRMVAGIRHFRPDVPIVRLLPAPHDSPQYPATGGHEPAVSEGRQWCRDVDVACIDLDPIVGPHLVAGRNNPDGLHWGWQAHREIGDALGLSPRTVRNDWRKAKAWLGFELGLTAT